MSGDWRLGWRVHHWMWPVVWWARRKSRSRFRQWLWDEAEALDWKYRIWPMYDRIKREGAVREAAHRAKTREDA